MNHRQPSSFGHFQEELSSALANKVPVVPEARGEESRASSALQLQLSQSLLLEIAKPELYRLFAAKLAQRGLFLVGLVHDELIIEVPEDAESIQDVEELCRAVEREFLGGIDMSLGLEHVPSARRVLRDLSTTEVKDLERDIVSGVFTAQELADKYQLKNADIVQSYKHRRGLTRNRGPAAPVSHPTKDLSAEIEATEARLAQLRAQAAEQGIKFEWAEESPLGLAGMLLDGVVVVYGVGDHFRAAGGFAKFRAWVERQVPQIGTSPVEPPKLDPTSQLLAEEVTNATDKINGHLSSEYVRLEDALDALLLKERTPWVVTRTSLGSTVGVSAIFTTKELAEAHAADQALRHPSEGYRVSAWRVHRSLSTL